MPADVRLVDISPDAKFDRSILTGILAQRDRMVEEITNVAQVNPCL